MLTSGVRSARVPADFTKVNGANDTAKKLIAGVSSVGSASQVALLWTETNGMLAFLRMAATLE